MIPFRALTPIGMLLAAAFAPVAGLAAFLASAIIGGALLEFMLFNIKYTSDPPDVAVVPITTSVALLAWSSVSPASRWIASWFANRGWPLVRYPIDVTASGKPS